MKNSTIEWTTHTFNPWWGCSKVSPGCANCYAERHARRFDQGLWGKGASRRTFPDARWAEPLRWDVRAREAGRRDRVFCASMGDVFDPDGPPAERERLWDLIGRTPGLDWLLLTKRPELAARYLPSAWLADPRPNVWVGASVEDAARRVRIDHLRAVQAAVRFLSVEPLLEDVGPLDLAGIDWVIVGGESGPKARPVDPAWVRPVRDRCVAAGVPFFFKQWGRLANNPDPTDPTAKENGGTSKGGCRLDGREWHELPAPVPAAAAAAAAGVAPPSRGRTGRSAAQRRLYAGMCPGLRRAARACDAAVAGTAPGDLWAACRVASEHARVSGDADLLWSGAPDRLAEYVGRPGLALFGLGFVPARMAADRIDALSAAGVARGDDAALAWAAILAQVDEADDEGRLLARVLAESPAPEELCRWAEGVGGNHRMQRLICEAFRAGAEPRPSPVDARR